MALVRSSHLEHDQLGDKGEPLNLCEALVRPPNTFRVKEQKILSRKFVSQSVLRIQKVYR